MQVINQASGSDWQLYHADCVKAMAGMPENSIHHLITSIPFASLYVYSASDNDMGNCSDYEQFSQQFQYFVEQVYRLIKPGRLAAIHCMNLPKSKQHDGVIGLRDFRGDVIRSFEAGGFIYHSEVCIWKDPVVSMQRTKAIGLLHKQLVKDSAISRQGVPDYLVVFRKPGVNEEPIAGKLEEFYGENPPVKSGKGDRDSIEIWQRYASPVWMDINPSDTLQFQSAKANEDLKHICPLQLTVIRRSLQLWSNPGDVVLDPFNGIGSSGHVALEMGRKYVGIELKESYFEASKINLVRAEMNQRSQLPLMQLLEESAIA